MVNPWSKDVSLAARPAMNEFLQEALQQGFTFHVLARHQSETTIGMHSCTTGGWGMLAIGATAIFQIGNPNSLRWL